MGNYARTDLACESVGSLCEEVKDTDAKERRVGSFTVQTLKISSEKAAKRIGKPCGIYITVNCGQITKLEEERDALIRLLAGELRGLSERLTGKQPNSDFGVLVVGLGNDAFTADAIGPKAVRFLTVTRHLRDYEEDLYREIGCCALSAIAPGVLGQTGMEALEVMQGAVRAVRPDLVIVIDALAARSCERLASTIQLSDTGLTPGSGVGNHRDAINMETVGVPVIAIGVPTIVDSSTLVYDALNQAGITHIDDMLGSVLENGRSFFVCPKESDLITEKTSVLLAQAIGVAFGGKFYS